MPLMYIYRYPLSALFLPADNVSPAYTEMPVPFIQRDDSELEQARPQRQVEHELHLHGEPQSLAQKVEGQFQDASASVGRQRRASLEAMKALSAADGLGSQGQVGSLRDAPLPRGTPPLSTGASEGLRMRGSSPAPSERPSFNNNQRAGSGLPLSEAEDRTVERSSYKKRG